MFVYMIIVYYDLTSNILQIPSEITAALEPIKDNEEAVRAYGIHLGTEMCRKILAHGIKTLHLYTLNMEKSALAILMVAIYFTTVISCLLIYYLSKNTCIFRILD